MPRRDPGLPVGPWGFKHGYRRSADRTSGDPQHHDGAAGEIPDVLVELWLKPETGAIWLA